MPPAARRAPDGAPGHDVAPVRSVLVLIALVTALPEVVASLADAGLIGSPRWRSLSYQYGAFWVGLLHGWQPNFALQPVTMFLSYAVLHAGPGHLAGNLGGVLLLGPVVGRQVGAAGLLAIWIGSALGGALGFGLLSISAAPMVGASGAVFGLAGAWVVQGWQRDRRTGRSRVEAARRVLGTLGLLVAVNLVSWVYEDGALAWETHLGGTLAGAGLALAWAGRGRLSASGG